MKAFLGGVCTAGGLLLLGWGVWIGEREYAYYQQVKAEHFEMKRYLEEVVVRFPDGKTLTRKQFLDGVIYSAFNQKKKD